MSKEQASSSFWSTEPITVQKYRYPPGSLVRVASGLRNVRLRQEPRWLTPQESSIHADLFTGDPLLSYGVHDLLLVLSCVPVDRNGQKRGLDGDWWCLVLLNRSPCEIGWLNSLSELEPVSVVLPRTRACEQGARAKRTSP